MRGRLLTIGGGLTPEEIAASIAAHEAEHGPCSHVVLCFGPGLVASHPAGARLVVPLAQPVSPCKKDAPAWRMLSELTEQCSAAALGYLDFAHVPLACATNNRADVERFIKIQKIGLQTLGLRALGGSMLRKLIDLTPEEDAPAPPAPPLTQQATCQRCELPGGPCNCGRCGTRLILCLVHEALPLCEDCRTVPGVAVWPRCTCCQVLIDERDRGICEGCGVEKIALCADCRRRFDALCATCKATERHRRNGVL